MKRIMILALIGLSLVITIYVAVSWNRPVWIDQIVPPGFVYETGADGLPIWRKNCAGLVHYYSPDNGPQHHFAVGNDCFISDNAPEAKAVLEKCPIGTGCRFKAEIIGVAPTIRFALRDRGRWTGCIVDRIVGPISRTAIVQPTAIAQPYYHLDEAR